MYFFVELFMFSIQSLSIFDSKDAPVVSIQVS